MTRFHTWRFRPLLWAGLLTLGAAAPGLVAHAAAVCVGDCNGNGIVSIAEAQACVNLGNNLQGPACAAADQNLDGTVEPNEVSACIQSFLDAATCPMVFTPAPTATNTQPPTATATNTQPPQATATNTPVATNTAVSTNTVSPTVTNTAAPTATITAEPTPTATGLTQHPCALAGMGKSKIGLFTEALGAPINFNISGSLSIGAGGASATCDIVSLNPVNIVGIGFVCIAPGPACPPATRWCGPGPGPALGIDSFSDGDNGACTSNADCATICAGPTLCNGAGNVLTAACTGFCTAGTEPTCNLDEDCLPSNGACNGPDPVMPNQNICQCSCINKAAHGPSDPGDLQCNLASNLIVEMASPCNGTDILINVGATCIPVSTQRATGLVSDSNFNLCGTAPCVVPVPPNINDQSGTPIACATMDAGTLTGFVGVGAVNFFGSSLGDLSVGLKATCQ